MLRTVQQFRCTIHSDESLSADGAAVHGEVGEGFVYGGIRTAFGKAHERQPRTKHALRGFTRNLTAHLTHKLWAVLPKEKRIRIPRPDADRTDSQLPACLPVNSLSNRHFGRCGIQIRMSKKQKTTNEWRCGPTSISGSVLLCRVLFCELKPFYRSQWPFSYGSHAPFSDESSSADMFFSQSLPPLFFPAENPPHRLLDSYEAARTNPFTIYYTASPRICQGFFAKKFSAGVFHRNCGKPPELRGVCAAGLSTVSTSAPSGDSLRKFQRKIIVFHKRGVDFQQRLWYTIILWTVENLGGTAEGLCGVAFVFPAHPSKHGVCRHSGTVIFSGRLFNTRRILPL